MKKLSVIIPVFNESGNIAALHAETSSVLSTLGHAYEIILVDDGSTDGTPEILKQLSPAKIIFLRKNFGQTAALDAGIKAASGDCLITMDGDGQNDPRDIPGLLAHLEEHGLDLVSGWRKKRHDSLFKRFESRGANFLRSLLIHDGIHDSGCSLKIYRRECLQNLNLYGEMHRFIPAMLKIRGFRVGEQVVNHRPRKSGRSKYNWQRSFKGFIDLLSVWFWKKFAVRPLHLLGGAGLLAFLAGSVCSLYTVWLFSKGQSLSDTVWPVLSLFLVLTGIQLFVSGLLADFLSKTYYETTQNRSYDIRQVMDNNG